MTAALAFLGRLARRVWFRAGVFTIAAVVFALAAGVVGTLIPFRLVIDLGQNSVGTILQILASSMLTVTTFSLTAMVTAYSSATTTATPRATQLMVEDTTSQNALSTFLGAFAYSLVGIIALSTGYYTDQGRTILFLGSLLVVVLIVVTLLRWIAHLAAFGRMGDVMDRVETAATDALRAHAQHPTLGARATDGTIVGRRVHADAPGYVAVVDVHHLQTIAERHRLRIEVMATAGAMADASHPLAVVAGVVDDDVVADVRQGFRLARHRDYEQDPRLGVIALAEIGSRALSPATNDPGTAIEVIGALQRVFTTLLTTPAEPEVRFDRVQVPTLSFVDILEDGFRPLSRDGAAVVEVGIRLQKALRALAATDPSRADVFAAAADAAASRASAALDRPDARRLREARRLVWG